MTTAMKRVFYASPLAHPVFEELLSKRPDVLLQKLGDDRPELEIAAVLAAAHAFQIGSIRNELAPRFHATSALLAKTPDLLVVSTNGAGYDPVDLDACTQAGVLVVNQAGGNAEAVAEHVLGMMLCLSKRIIETDRRMRREADIPRNEFTGANVLEKTIGIIGIGHVGTRVAELCRGPFRMRVLACDPYLSAGEIAARGGEKVALDELLRRADYVSVNCPLTGETRGMLGAREYALMQKHAYLISTARGGIHDEAALAEALRERRIAGAGLDVWEPEPPSPEHPLLQLDNVLASPHTAGGTHEARRNIGTIAAQQLLEVLDGKRPPRLLNPQAWPVFAKKFERVFGSAPAA